MKSTPPPCFRINSHPVSLAAAQSPSEQRAIKFLDALPPGELVTIVQLSAKIGMSVNTLKNIAGHMGWGGRRVKHANRMLYGNAKTISAYKEHFQL